MPHATPFIDPTDANEYVTLALGIIALLGAVLAWIRWVRPRIRRGRAEITAVRHALLGREEIVDSITGKTIEPALPGIGTRMANQEQQMELLAVTVTKLVDQQVHQQKLEERVDLHEARLVALEEQTIERVAAKAESISAWRAVEAVAKQTPDPDPAPAPEIED